MKQLSKFWIDVDKRETETGFIADRVWIHGELAEHGKGINYISFLLIGDEWKKLFSGLSGHLEDGYHVLRVFGECWTFIDLDGFPPSAETGTQSVRFTRITMPRDIRKRIKEDIELALDECSVTRASEYAGLDKFLVRLDYSDKVKEWSNDYGQGKGQVEIQADTVTRDKLGAAKTKGGESFERSWQAIERLALNTTHKKTDVAIIRVYNDHAGFTWSAGGLFGGLINHGSEDEPDWSVHT